MPIERYNPIPWETLQAQAEALAGSAFVPAPYRGKPGDVLAAGLYGQEIGLGISAALSYIHVINGRPTLSAEGMTALVRARGHSIGGGTTAMAANIRGKRADTGDEMEVEWTIAMAERAGLLKKAGSNWAAYPEAMLWARAVSQLCRMLFPDVLLGLSYTPEEARDFEAVEVISVTSTPRPQTAEAAVEETPAPLRRITQAGPPGLGDSITYVDENGEQMSRQDGEAEQERRELIAWLIEAKKGLSAAGLKTLEQERVNAGHSMTKLLRDHTLDELRELKALTESVAGGPF